MKAQRFIPLLVVAAGCLAYHNSFTGPFIFDDVDSIENNPTIRQLWPISLPLSPLPAGGATVEGRPLINLSLAANYAFSGTNVWGYHALNLAVHILAGLTLFGVVRRTLLQPRLRGRFGAAADQLALATAVIWTVHPLQTESVTYIVQRAESITGLFYLLTLYCFIRAAESPRPRSWYDLCVVSCALGMAGKEIMASAPLLVMLYDRAFVSGSFRGAWRQRWPLYVGLASTWFLLGYLVLFTGPSSAMFATARIVGVSWWEYLLTQPGVILHYLRLSVWPVPLCLDYYGWPLAKTWQDILPPALGMAVLLGATAWACRINSAWGVLGAWFFLVLAPSSSFIPLDCPAYEHRMYLPLAAVVIVAMIGIHALAGRRTAAVALMLAIGLAFLTARRNEDYRSELSIWADTTLKQPQNPRANDTLAFALWRVAKLEKADGHYQQALVVKPGSPAACNNLAVALARLGRWRQAIELFEQALRTKPEYPQAEDNLAWLLATLPLAEGGNPPRAVILAGQACQLTGGHVAVYFDTQAAAYAAAGRSNDAILAAQRAVDLARAAGQTQAVTQIESRLQLYRSGQVCRQSR